MSDFPVPPMFPPMDDGNKGPKPLPGGNMNQPPRPPKAPPDSYEGSGEDKGGDKRKRSNSWKEREISYATLKKNLTSKKVLGTMPPKVMKEYRRESIRADNPLTTPNP